MSKIKATATFSDGTARPYKGTRDVKAAWAIQDQNGNTLMTGFSMDREKAAKTAEGNKIYALDAAGIEPNFPLKKFPRPSRSLFPGAKMHFEKEAKRFGFRTWSEAYEAQQKEQNRCTGMLKVEIINL